MKVAVPARGIRIAAVGTGFIDTSPADAFLIRIAVAAFGLRYTRAVTGLFALFFTALGNTGAVLADVTWKTRGATGFAAGFCNAISIDAFLGHRAPTAAIGGGNAGAVAGFFAHLLAGFGRTGVTSAVAGIIAVGGGVLGSCVAAG